MTTFYTNRVQVAGSAGALTKVFTFRGPAETKDRKWLDVEITSSHDKFDGTLSKAQARALVNELVDYFGFKQAGIISPVETNVPACRGRADGGQLPHLPGGPVERKAPNGPQAYRGNGKHEMERVANDLYRQRVPGGWLYFDTFVSPDQPSGPGSRQITGSPTFVPVPEVVGYKI